MVQIGEGVTMFEWHYEKEFYGVDPKDVASYSYKEPKLLLYLQDGRQFSCKMYKTCFSRFKNLMEEKNA